MYEKFEQLLKEYGVTPCGLLLVTTIKIKAPISGAFTLIQGLSFVFSSTNK